MKKNIRTLILLGVAITLAACGRTYQAKPLSFRPPSAYPNALSVMGVTVGAKAFTDAETAGEAFGFDIRGSGLLPVQVVFHNESSHPLEINAAQSYLEDDGGNLWPLLARQVAYERVSTFSKTREVFSEGAKAGFFGAAAGALIGSAVGIVAGQNVLEAAGKGAAVGAAAGGTLGGIKGYTSDDARREISDQDVGLAGYILEQGRSLVLAVSKWDGLDEAQRAWIRREIERKLSFVVFAPPHFISALESSGIAALFPAIDRAFASANADLPTAQLNRVLEKAVQATPPPIAQRRRIKLKFAHQSGHNPPRVTIFGNQVAAVPDSYRRYLANCFRDAFHLEGTPVRIDFKQGENPFAVKKPKRKQSPRLHALARRDERIKKKRKQRERG